MLRTSVHPRPLAAPPKHERSVSIPVEGGVHRGLPAHALPPGMSPDVRNFYPTTDGWIEPRSGLSSFGTHTFSGAVLGAAEVFDVAGTSCGFAPSSVSFSFLHPDAQIWSSLSYVQSNVTHMRGTPSGQSTDYFRTTSVYDAGTDSFIAVTSNNTNSVKFFTVASNASVFSDFSWVDSLSSTMKAKDVVAINDRLVFFNTESSDGTRYVTRVLWSARGDPKNYQIASEAGFEDLMGMRGEGQAAVRFRDFLLLFTEYEVWRGTPTLDAYAFRFDRVVDNVGCPFPKTIAVTPNGVIFMEHDREIYITDGNAVASLGPVGAEGPSRIQRILQDDAVNMDRSWGIYNHSENRYELYYTASDSSEGFPTRSLWYDITKRSWWPQYFSHEVTSGIDMYDPAVIVTYDEIEDSYDSVALNYDAYDVVQRNRLVNIFTSGGSTLRFRSAQTSDNGSAIDARWRSPGLKSPDHRKFHMTDVWTDYETDSASSASLFLGDARDPDGFDATRALSLTTSAAPIFSPCWTTSQAPAFELRLNDGGRPRITSFTATLRSASRF